VGCPVAATSGIPPLQGLWQGATALLDHHGYLAMERATPKMDDPKPNGNISFDLIFVYVASGCSIYLWDFF
jgi:hypothetical protein